MSTPAGIGWITLVSGTFLMMFSIINLIGPKEVQGAWLYWPVRLVWLIMLLLGAAVAAVGTIQLINPRLIQAWIRDYLLPLPVFPLG